MVDGLFFCALLTGRRGDHKQFVQLGAETSNTGAEAVSRTQAVLGRVIPGELVGEESTESRGALQPFHIPPHFCYCRQIN